MSGYGLHRYGRSALIQGVAETRRDAIFSAILAHAGAYGYPNVPPLLVLAQSAFETGWWTSRLVVEQNNAFGMRQPQQRPTVSLGAGPTGFARYATLSDSVRDYFLRQQYFGIPDSMLDTTYMHATLASGYSGEGHYLDTWRDVYRMLIASGYGSDATGGVGPVEPPDDPAVPADRSWLPALLLGAVVLAAK